MNRLRQARSRKRPRLRSDERWRYRAQWWGLLDKGHQAALMNGDAFGMPCRVLAKMRHRVVPRGRADGTQHLPKPATIDAALELRRCPRNRRHPTRGLEVDRCTGDGRLRESARQSLRTARETRTSVLLRIGHRGRMASELDRRVRDPPAGKRQEDPEKKNAKPNRMDPGVRQWGRSHHQRD